MPNSIGNWVSGLGKRIMDYQIANRDYAQQNQDRTFQMQQSMADMVLKRQQAERDAEYHALRMQDLQTKMNTPPERSYLDELDEIYKGYQATGLLPKGYTDVKGEREKEAAKANKEGKKTVTPATLNSLYNQDKRNKQDKTLFNAAVYNGITGSIKPEELAQYSQEDLSKSENRFNPSITGGFIPISLFKNVPTPDSTNFNFLQDFNKWDDPNFRQQYIRDSLPSNYPEYFGGNSLTDEDEILGQTVFDDSWYKLSPQEKITAINNYRNSLK